MSNLVFFSLEW